MPEERYIRGKAAETPVDAVVAWVDGGDPEHAAKLARYLPEGKRLRIPGADPTRFASVDEIRYCVLSILRFAPFIRNIYILTDNQDPGLYDDIERYFPGKKDSVRIVDHTEVFRGFEKYLPTFSSRSIGSMAWRIEGLSDNFVYFNDDTFLIREVQREDWFRNGHPVLRGRWLPVPVMRILINSIRKLVHSVTCPGKQFTPRASYHMGQWGAARRAGLRWRYFYFGHAPFALARRIMEDYFKDNQAVMEENISYRFRSHHQFDFISLVCHLELYGRNRNIVRDDLVYLQPYRRGSKYLRRKLKRCDTDNRKKFLCVQSLDLCSSDQQEIVINWLGNRLNLNDG